MFRFTARRPLQHHADYRAGGGIADPRHAVDKTRPWRCTALSRRRNGQGPQQAPPHTTAGAQDQAADAHSRRPV
jgi:hypothetical protein